MANISLKDIEDAYNKVIATNHTRSTFCYLIHNGQIYRILNYGY